MRKVIGGLMLLAALGIGLALIASAMGTANAVTVFGCALAGAVWVVVAIGLLA